MTDILPAASPPPKGERASGVSAAWSVVAGDELVYAGRSAGDAFEAWLAHDDATLVRNGYVVNAQRTLNL